MLCAHDGVFMEAYSRASVWGVNCESVVPGCRGPVFYHPVPSDRTTCFWLEGCAVQRNH